MRHSRRRHNSDVHVAHDPRAKQLVEARTNDGSGAFQLPLPRHVASADAQGLAIEGDLRGAGHRRPHSRPPRERNLLVSQRRLADDGRKSGRQECLNGNHRA